MKVLGLFSFIFLFISSCKTGKVALGKNERGCYYAMYKYKAVNTDSVTVFGRIRAEYSDTPPAVLTIDGNVHYVSQAGTYKARLGHGRHSLTALGMMYNTLKLPSMSLTAGDSIRIDFFLTASKETVCDGEGL